MKDIEHRIRQSLSELSNATPVRARPALSQITRRPQRRRVAFAAAATLLLGAGIATWRLWPDSTHQLRSTTTGDELVTDAAPATSSLVTDGSASPVTSATTGPAPSSDSLPALPMITRPYLDPSICADGSKTTYAS